MSIKNDVLVRKKKDSIKKNKYKNPSFFSELGVFMRPYRFKYFISVAVSVLSVAMGMGAYVFVGFISYNLFSQTPDFKKSLFFAIGAIICKILSAVTLNFSTWISHCCAYGTLKDIRIAVEEKMIRIPLGYFEENGSGRLKSIVVDHIENMEKTLAHMLPELTSNLLVPVILIIWMFFIDWRLALLVILWIILGLSVTSGMMKGYDEKYKSQINIFKSMNQAVVEFVKGIEVIKNFGRTDSCYKKYEDAIYGHADYNVNWQKETQRYTSLGMAIAPFSVFPLLIFGLVFYGQGTLEAGTLFMMILLSFGIFGPIMNASNYFDRLAGMGTDAKEIKDILDYNELERKVQEDIITEKIKSTKDINYKNVCFSYKNSEKPTLSEITFNIKEKTMFALVGASGSGKSTVAKLLAGFFDVDSGEITIGGKNLKDHSQEELNRMIAFVDQETFLFDMSIADNIRIGKPDASDEEVIEAAKKAGCDTFIRGLPFSYNTMAGDAGKKLSGGERQRITIARAMMKNAPIMILDEATSSTDPENEYEIQKAVTKASEGKTLIVIAHRLATVKDANKIAFMKNGRIEKIGTHEELINNCKDYADMWAMSEER